MTITVCFHYPILAQDLIIVQENFSVSDSGRTTQSPNSQRSKNA